MNTSSSASDCSSDLNSECDTFHELLRFEKAKNPYFGIPAANRQKDKKKQTEVYCKLCSKKLNLSW